MIDAVTLLDSERSLVRDDSDKRYVTRAVVHFTEEMMRDPKFKRQINMVFITSALSANPHFASIRKATVYRQNTCMVDVHASVTNDGNGEIGIHVFQNGLFIAGDRFQSADANGKSCEMYIHVVGSKPCYQSRDRTLFNDFWRSIGTNRREMFVTGDTSIEALTDAFEITLRIFGDRNHPVITFHDAMVEYLLRCYPTDFETVRIQGRFYVTDDSVWNTAFPTLPAVSGPRLLMHLNDETELLALIKKNEDDVASGALMNAAANTNDSAVVIKVYVVTTEMFSALVNNWQGLRCVCYARDDGYLLLEGEDVYEFVMTNEKAHQLSSNEFVTYKFLLNAEIIEFDDMLEIFTNAKRAAGAGENKDVHYNDSKLRKTLLTDPRTRTETYMTCNISVSDFPNTRKLVALRVTDSAKCEYAQVVTGFMEVYTTLNAKNVTQRETPLHPQAMASLVLSSLPQTVSRVDADIARLSSKPQLTWANRATLAILREIASRPYGEATTSLPSWDQPFAPNNCVGLNLLLASLMQHYFDCNAMLMKNSVHCICIVWHRDIKRPTIRMDATSVAQMSGELLYTFMSALFGEDPDILTVESDTKRRRLLDVSPADTRDTTDQASSTTGQAGSSAGVSATTAYRIALHLARDMWSVSDEQFNAFKGYLQRHLHHIVGESTSFKIGFRRGENRYKDDAVIMDVVQSTTPVKISIDRQGVVEVVDASQT